MNEALNNIIEQDKDCLLLGNVGNPILDNIEKHLEDIVEKHLLIYLTNI